MRNRIVAVGGVALILFACSQTDESTSGTTGSPSTGGSTNVSGQSGQNGNTPTTTGGEAGSQQNQAGSGTKEGGSGQGGTSSQAGQAGSESGVGGMTVTPSDGKVGSPCTEDSQCEGGDKAQCLPSTEWPNGYCVIVDCESGSCPSGSECYQLSSGDTLCLDTCENSGECRDEYACHNVGACIPACSPTSCGDGQVCNSEGLCEDAPCTAQSCPGGLVCDSASGKCIADLANDPGPGPGPTCTDLPERDCQGDNAFCGQLMAFEPVQGPGYENYPINGETSTNQYRSYARRDLQMLIKYASAFVACKAGDWKTGNGGLIGLGDMSEKDGSIPGTSIGEPGHPEGTHLNGYDMDIGYFQTGTPDNKLRPICEHMQNGADQYHCVTPPNKLDVWRDALFLGALFSSKRVRVIGVDGKVGPLVLQAMDNLCAKGWLAAASCSAAHAGLAYEETNMNYGWFQFHHHHQHISLKSLGSSNVSARNLWPEGNGELQLLELKAFSNKTTWGHAHVHNEVPAFLGSMKR
jgi:hypothetical protein